MDSLPSSNDRIFETGAIVWPPSDHALRFPINARDVYIRRWIALEVHRLRERQLRSQALGSLLSDVDHGADFPDDPGGRLILLPALLVDGTVSGDETCTSRHLIHFVFQPLGQERTEVMLDWRKGVPGLTDLVRELLRDMAGTFRELHQSDEVKDMIAPVEEEPADSAAESAETAPERLARLADRNAEICRLFALPKNAGHITGGQLAKRFDLTTSMIKKIIRHGRQYPES